MKTSDFYFELPEELIAQYPPAERGNSRLLVYNRNSKNITHSSVTEMGNFIDENSVIVFNNTRVRKARIYGVSGSGGKTEFLLLTRNNDRSWNVICSKAKKQRPGKTFFFPEEVTGRIAGETADSKKMVFSPEIDDLYLEKYGHVPLPPYIKRNDDESDSNRYQTIFSRVTGSAAAPTAGLHFTDLILDKLNQKGIKICFITLHVGMGTFKPLRCSVIEEHVMHEECYEISEETAEILNKAKSERKKITTVGTTSLRALESSWSGGKILHGEKTTSLFVYPGYNFNVVDHLFTNFHTPDSSLILLVSAFAGINEIKTAYQEAIKEKYMFYSYGDAMLIL